MNNYYYKSTPLSDIMELGTSTITKYNITTAKATTEPQAIITGGVSNFFLDTGTAILNGYSGKKLISGDTTITAADWVTSYKVKLASVNGNKGTDGVKGADAYEQTGGGPGIGGNGGIGRTLVSNASGLEYITKNASITANTVAGSISIKEGASTIFKINAGLIGNNGTNGNNAVPRTKGGTPARCGGYRSQNGWPGNKGTDGNKGSDGTVENAPVSTYTSEVVSNTTRVIELYGFTN